jgi:hypothetical protein
MEKVRIGGPFLGKYRTTSLHRPARQPPILCVMLAISPGVKRPGSEAEHPPPSSARVKNCVGLHLDSISWRNI